MVVSKNVILDFRGICVGEKSKIYMFSIRIGYFKFQMMKSWLRKDHK